MRLQELFQRVLDSRSRLFGSEHPETLWTVVGVAMLREKQCDWDAAEAHFRRSERGYEEAYGKEHTKTIDAARGVV